MIKKFLQYCLFGLLFISYTPITASGHNRIDYDVGEKNQTVAPQKKRSFKKLDTVYAQKIFDHSLHIGEFTDAHIKKHFVLDTVTNELVLEAKNAMDELEVSQNFVEVLSPDDMVTLPIGVKKVIGNITYTLGITKAKITPTYMEVTAFVKIVIPHSDGQGNRKELFFGANNIKLSHKGGIYGDAHLVLLGDVPIPISGGKSMVVLNGGFNMQTGNTQNLTYVTIDCGGFKELGVDANLLFSRNMLEPVNANYEVIKNKDIKVSGHFKAIVGDWNDILVEVNLPPFQLAKPNSKDGTGKAGLIFELNTAVFDFSDIRNSPNVIFPEGYHQYLIPGNEQLWRGVYVNTLKIVLPKQFKKRKNEDRMTFQASRLLIDGVGVSGEFSASNILPINEGSAAKWQFSVDRIQVDLTANELVEAGFDGRIVLPVTEEVAGQEV